jgi:hypothetical protein
MMMMTLREVSTMASSETQMKLVQNPSEMTNGRGK